MKNKKILIISLAVFLLILLVLLVVLVKLKKSPIISNGTDGSNANLSATPYKPEFLSQEEKAKWQIPTDLKIQVLTKGDKGEPTVYKIIKTDSDIVTDLTQVKTISPRAK